MKNKKLLLTTSTALLIFILILIPISRPKVEITSSIPNPGAIDVQVATPIQLELSKTINPQDITITSNPKETWNIVDQESKSNSISIKSSLALRPGTEYTVYAEYRNKLIYSLTFTTTSNIQSNPRGVQELDEKIKQEYPLANLLPYKTPNFEVVYQAPLLLEIQVNAGVNKSNEELINEVKTWVKQNNVDPETHDYRILRPEDIPTTTITN